MADLRTSRLSVLVLSCLLAFASAWQEDLVARHPNTTVGE